MLAFIYKNRYTLAILTATCIMTCSFSAFAQQCEGYSVEGVQVTEDSHGDVQVEFDITSDILGQQLFVNVVLTPNTNINIISDYSLIDDVGNDGTFQFTAEGEYIDAIIGLPDDLELSGIIYIGTVGDDLVCELPFENIPAGDIIYIDFSDDDLYTSYDVCGQLFENAWVDMSDSDYGVINIDVFGGADVAAIDNQNYYFNLPIDFQQYFVDGVDIDINQYNPETLNIQIGSLNMAAMEQDQDFTFSVSVNVNDNVFCEVPVTINLAAAVISGTIINTDDVFEPNRVFPNPADDVTTIEIAEYNQTAENEIEIINIAGQTIIELETNEEVTTIDVSTLPPGMYILKVNNGINIKTNKLMIE